MHLVSGDEASGPFRTAGWMLANLSVSHSVLLRWVANEIVRVRIVDAARPLYSLDDVTRVMKEMALGRNQKPRTGRPRRAARAAK